MPKAKTIAVVGGGIGGLAAAARLAAGGYSVELFEQNPQIGGKACEKRHTSPEGSFRWDCGPSLATMPQTLHDLFESCGDRLENYLDLQPVPTACRYFWADGTTIDEDADFWNLPEVQAYLKHAEGIYQLSADYFLEHIPGDWMRAISPKMLKALKHLPKLATTKTLAKLNRQFFTDPRLIQIFDRFATYNGSSPFKTPATFAIIPYVEAVFGAWYPKGGMARIPEAIRALAEKQGVAVRCNRKIRELRRLPHDVIVCNGDPIAACTHWLPASKYAAQLQRRELSCSAFVMLVAAKGDFPSLAHHNIFFSGDYEAEFRDIFQARKPADEPTIYISASCMADPADAPRGCLNLFVMANAPANPQADFSTYPQTILRRLEQFGLRFSVSDIIHKETLGPRDFRTRDSSWEGALYGWASHSRETALHRPPIRHPKWKNIFFVGGATHPGGGIPLVLQSAKIASNLVRRHYPKPAA